MSDFTNALTIMTLVHVLVVLVFGVRIVMKRSAPGPPFIRSLPVPPSSESSPLLPNITSLPTPPLSRSIPWPP